MAASTKTAVAKKVTKKPKSHPPYAEMVKEAIVALKEKTGSSQYAIAKHIEDIQKDLLENFRKHLLVQLKKLVAAGKLTKVKNSFKLGSVEKEKKAPLAKKAKAGGEVKVAKVKVKVKTPVKAKKGVPVKASAKKPKSIKSSLKKVAAKKVKK